MFRPFVCKALACNLWHNFCSMSSVLTHCIYIIKVGKKSIFVTVCITCIKYPLNKSQITYLHVKIAHLLYFQRFSFSIRVFINTLKRRISPTMVMTHGDVNLQPVLFFWKPYFILFLCFFFQCDLINEQYNLIGLSRVSITKRKHFVRHIYKCIDICNYFKGSIKTIAGYFYNKRLSVQLFMMKNRQ